MDYSDLIFKELMMDYSDLIFKELLPRLMTNIEHCTDLIHGSSLLHLPYLNKTIPLLYVGLELTVYMDP